MPASSRERVAFDLYVSLGPQRSIERLHGELQNDPGAHGLKRPPALRTLYRWSKEQHWQLRLAQLEEQARERDAQFQVEQLHQMNERHAKEGLALQQKAIAALHALVAGDLSASDAIRALSEGIRIERLARGEATSRTDLISPIGNALGELDDEHLVSLTLTAQRLLEGTREAQP